MNLYVRAFVSTGDRFAVPTHLISRVVPAAQITKLAPEELKGSVVAVDMALGSLARMVAPGAGGWLISRYGYSSIGLSSSAIMLAAVALCTVRHSRCADLGRQSSNL